MIELAEATEDMAGVIDRNGLGPILRGAILSPTLKIDAHFSAAVSTTSPLYKLPVDAVQRGRDHGEIGDSTLHRAWVGCRSPVLFDSRYGTWRCYRFAFLGLHL